MALTLKSFDNANHGQMHQEWQNANLVLFYTTVVSRSLLFRSFCLSTAVAIIIIAMLEIVSRGRGYVRSTWPNHSPGSPHDKSIITIEERDT